MSSAVSTEAAAAGIEPGTIVIAAPGLWRRVWKNKAVVIGGGLLLLIVAVALLAPWIAPYDPYAQDLANRNVPPFWYDAGSWAHPLGTDPLGRDYLSRLFYGARISLLIGISVAIISGLIGTTMGMLAGYFGG
ncbi:MAG: ABC transporter permease, partial [Burkholderiaceae bacterium]